MMKKAETDEISKALLESRQIKTRREITFKAVTYVFLTLTGITMMLPFLWMISTSLKEPQAVYAFPPKWIPDPVVWASYLKVWSVVPFAKFYLNSIFVALAVTLGQVMTSAFAAYAFARLTFPSRDKLFFSYLATMMIPGSVTLVPVYILMVHFRWIDSYKALIIPAMFSAYGTFMLRQFFMGIPRDLEDAARIDGCSLFGIFWKIILPLSKPILATLTTFTFMASWNNFMWPLLVTESVEKKTLPIGLAYFQEVYQYTQPDWSLLMAGSLLVTIPVILVFVFNQRFFVEGIKLSGIKG
ncbi:MAG: carbohydrate ABC transporter permease [Candidatus Omnitrophica bacterium]|nr:carbohydrate ABC transporter permease [Candidatus Omnitrophota bacterium]